MKRIKPLPLKNVTINDRFWGRYIRLIRDKVIGYQWDALNDRVPDAAKSHCIKNFEIAAGLRNDTYYGMAFQDSDLYKWLETVAYSLETQPDPELEKLADGAISLIGAAQRPDGYINTYFTIKEPDNRWANLQQGHELYCAGHMIEAAVAYYYATGKREFLDISIRFADYIDSVFGLDEGKIQGYPGHQEIELGLFKLYEATAEPRYLKLAAYFINQRGASPNYFDIERQQPKYHDIFPEIADLDRSYSQSHMPAVEQRQAAGHAVRAVYMYAAMADLAAELNDESLITACSALYESIAQSRMYITGAIGSTSIGESFTSAFDLPDDMIYGETCASVGLMRFCRRMNSLSGDAKFADTMERALYNTVIAGISLKGTEFFYVNPLAVEPSRVAGSPYYNHVYPVRQKWFDCSCCPTNIARTVMGLGEFIYGTSSEGLYINLYCSGSAVDGSRKISVNTYYPYGGEATITADGGSYKLFLRNPENAPALSLKINGAERNFTPENGYIVLDGDWDADEITILFDMQPKLVYSTPSVQDNIGKAAVMRGPLVYCMEQVDNGECLAAVYLPDDCELATSPAPDGLPTEAVGLTTNAWRYKSKSSELYSSAVPFLEEAAARFIPYHLWANRGENEMRVFTHIVPHLPVCR